MGTDEQTMAWIMDTYSMHMRQTVTAVVTGKPVSIGGSRGRREAHRTRHLGGVRLRPEALNLPVEGCRSSSRASATSAPTPQVAAREGPTLSSASPSGNGGLYNAEGLDIPSLLSHRHRTGSITGFAGAEAVDPAELLTRPCEILIPAGHRERHHQPERRPVAVPHPVRGCQRPHLPWSPTTSWLKRASSSCPTSWPTPAASPPATSSGCRTAWATSGPRPRSTSVWTPS